MGILSAGRFLSTLNSIQHFSEVLSGIFYQFWIWMEEILAKKG